MNLLRVKRPILSEKILMGSVKGRVGKCANIY